MKRNLTLGSLFDGIGGFPFCAELSGITPVWAAEIEPMCVAVTKRHFPNMLHFGDVPKISDMSEADYLFFRDVFCIDREINGKAVKKLPTKPQIIKWHNKLDSDSRRYKALGNSLAIPCALRVIGGIAKYMEG